MSSFYKAKYKRMRTSNTIFGGKLMRWLTLTIIVFIFAQQQALPCSDLTISGSTTICEGSTTQINFSINQDDGLPPWRIIYAIDGIEQPEITGITNTSFNIITSTPGLYTGVSIYDANDCLGVIFGSATLTQNPLPGNPGSISGDANVCQGEAGVIYTVPVITNANSYEWTLPTGVNLAGQVNNQITANYSLSAISGFISVRGVNDCGPGNWSNFAVDVQPQPAAAGTITGLSTVCQGQNSVVYTVPSIANATGYLWALPSGANIVTQNNNSITVNFGTSALSGNITVTGTNNCGNGQASSLNITVNPLPGSSGTISGINTVCRGQSGISFSIPPIVNASGYLWNLPMGFNITSGQNTNSITIDVSPTASSGQITVAGVNSCGQGITSPPLNITVNDVPATPAGISGLSTVCQGVSGVIYSVAAITGATSYEWQLPSGITFSGGSTNQISANFSLTAISGTIQVRGINSCGEGPWSQPFNVTVNTLPQAAGTISGDNQICAPSNGLIFTVANITGASSYEWEFPSGFTVTGSDQQNSITLNALSNANSGGIRVRGINDCGTSSFSPVFNISVSSPATAFAGNNSSICEGSTFDLNQATATNYSSIQWTTTGDGSFSNSNVLRPEYTPGNNDIQNGIVDLTLVVTGNGVCPNATSSLTLSISKIPVVYAGNDISTCEQSGQLSLSGTSSNCQSIVWSTSGDGTFGNPSSLTSNYLPGPDDIINGSVTLTLTGNGSGACGSQVSDVLTISITRRPVVEAGNNIQSCQDAPVNLTGSAQYYQSIQWSSSGSGSFSSTNTLNTTYTPSAADINAGNVTISLSAQPINPCSNLVTDNLTLIISSTPAVNAGADIEICAVSGAVQLSGTASNCGTLIWSSNGNGTFSNPGSLTTMYLPGTSDITNGSSILTLSGTGNGACNSTVQDNLALQIIPVPQANAGANIQSCGDEPINLNGTANDYFSVIWTTSGNGTFLDRNNLETVYYPSNDDVAAGTFTIRLTANPISPCMSDFIDDLTVTINEEPIVFAGPDITSCGTQGFTITGSQAQNYSSLTWSTSGSGTFDSPNGLSPTYYPSLADVTAGSVILTLSAQGTGDCSGISVSDDMILNLNAEPTVNAGPPATVCQGTQLEITDATASNYQVLTWLTSGSGTFINNGTLNPTYLPSVADINQGMITLTLRATPLAPCSTPVSSSKIINFSINPTVYAGIDATVCDNSSYTISDALASNYGSLSWSTNGTGSFSSTNSLNTTYTPSNSDVLNGSVTLTLTAYGNATCNQNAIDQLEITITQSPVADAGSGGVICENSSFTVTTATASANTTIQWSSSGTGTLVSGGSLTPTYTPSAQDALNGTVVLTMTVTGNPPCNTSIQDNITIAIIPEPIPDAGANFSVCGLTPFTITNASATNYTSISWTTNGTGSLSNTNRIDPTYIPSAADLANGNVTLTMSLTGNFPCNQVISDQVLVTINQVPVINAGPDITICEGPHNITGATAINYSTLQWSTINGDGVFNNGSALNAIYTPGTADLLRGYVTLTLTAVALPPCTDVISDNVIYTIKAEPTAYAGPDVIICEGSNYLLQHATAQDYTSIIWTTSGSGYFNNANTTNPLYYPSLADIANGSVILTMTLENSPCLPVYDEMTLVINHNPTANAGSDATICEGDSYMITDASALNCSTYLWTTTGSGALQNPTTLTPTYIPSAADIMAGSVQLMLSVDAQAPCVANDYDLMTIYITRQPIVQAGSDITICENQTHSITDATASYYSSVLWSSTGDGVITGSNTLFPTYTPGLIDATLGYVTLTLRAYGNSPCIQPVTDEIYITIENTSDIYAGSDITICSGSNIALTEAIADHYSTLRWSTSGNGSFSDPTMLHPVYTPSPQDISNGTIILTLTGSPVSPCSDYTTDALVLNISQPPQVNAGSDGTICETSQYYIFDASASDYSVITWTTMGDGFFSNQNSINPTYTPGPNDRAAGSVLLYLNATSLLPCTGDVSDAMELVILPLPNITAGPDASVCENNTYLLSGATALNYGSLQWTTSGSGWFSNASVLNSIYTPSSEDILNGSVTLILTAQGILPCTDQVDDQMELNIEAAPIANAGPDQEICVSNYTITTATAQNYHHIQWTSSGSSGTLLNANTITPTYIPSALDITNGSVVLTLTASANFPCSVDAVDQMTIIIRETTVVSAGQDVTICEGSVFTPSDASATNYASIQWTTSGTGLFINANTINPTYTPSPADIALGWVNLTLTATSNAPCTQVVSDAMRLTLVRQPIVDAGPNVTICEGQNLSTNNASVNNHTSLVWTTTGDGVFLDPSQLSTTYTPGVVDIANGSAVLRLTATGNAPCNTPATDFVILTIQGLPSLDAGPNVSICENETFVITNASADNYSSLLWTTSGNGTFIDPTSINPEYIPGTADILSGSVTITLTVTGDSPCSSTTSDSFILTINQIAEVNAGADGSVCENGSFIISDATGTHYSSINWSTNGSGSFINGSSLNATYLPSAEDAIAGQVTLTLTATSIAPCSEIVTDTKVITVIAMPVIEAGPDGEICSDTYYNITGASATGYASLLWQTSGTGQFSNNTQLNPTYTPSVEDINFGSVVLTLNAISNSPCTSNPSDSFTLTINRTPDGTAGADDVVCENNSYTVTDASASAYASINWTTNGSGILTGANTLNPVYTTSTADALAGSVTMTMTLSGNGSCGTFTDQKVISIQQIAEVYAGLDASICIGAVYTLSNAVASDYQSVLWTTNGSGSFTNPNLVNTDYIPSAADYVAGQVLLTITAESVYPCSESVSDLIVLQFNDSPIANAGPDDSICEGSVYNIISASAINYSTIVWTTSGTGHFSAGNTLTPTYTPSTDDLATGFVTLTLHALGTPPCAEDTDDLLLRFIKAPTANAGSDALVCEGTIYTVYDASASNYSSINWTTSGSGNLTGTNTLNPTYLPSLTDLDLGYVTITMTVNAELPCIGQAVSSKTLTFTRLPIVTAGSDGILCAGDSYTITDATSQNTSSIWWTTSGSGSFVDNGTLTPTYTPSEADFASGSVILTISGQPGAGCSSEVSDAMTLTLVPYATANAGLDAYICEEDSYTVYTASATLYSSVLWTTTGSGPLINAASLTPTYSPSQEDINNGSVTLTLTVISASPCLDEVTDQMIIYINQSPEANAGSDATICEGNNYTINDASVTAGYTYSWSTSGSGNFLQPNTLTPTYIPSIADINAGYVTISLSIEGSTSCPEIVTDQMVLTINRMVVVNAGTDDVVCEGINYTLGNATALNFSSVMWSTSGTGSFINPAEVNATYVPSSDDVLNGSVLLTLTGTASGVCTGNNTDMMTLTFETLPIVNAGSDMNVCESSITINGASASNYNSLLWTTSGTGIVSNSNTLTPTYTPSPLDLATGIVDLTLTAQSLTPCTGSVSDVVRITFNNLPTVSAGIDGSICENSTFTINGATAQNTSLITWSTSGSGTFNDIHSLNATYTPSIADIQNGSVVLTITGDAIAPCSESVTDQLTVTISKSALVNAGLDGTTCDDTYLISGASASNYSSLIWTTSGTGTFINGSTLTPVYTPSAQDKLNGSVILTLTGQSNAPCTNESVDFMILTLPAGATAYAGMDASVCEGSTFLVGTASATGYSSLNWTSSGTGTFSGQNTLNPSYNPSATDIANGSVTLTLTANAQAPCLNSATDEMLLVIDRNPIAIAGQDVSICGATIVNLSGTVSNSTLFSWSTNGDGSFTNPSTLTPSYTPGTGDINTESVTITLTAQPTGTCTIPAVDQLIITIGSEPVVNAGLDATICSDTYTLSGFAENYSVLSWSTSGTGTFINVGSSNATYVASIADVNSGSVTLTLNATGISPCTTVVSDAMVLTFTPEPVANAGQDASVCGDASYNLINATALNYSQITWSTSGSGTFSDASVINPVYYPSTTDVSAGTVTLTLSVTGVNLCNLIDIDQMVLTFSESPTANAGIDMSSCGNAQVQIVGANATNYSSLLWTHNGTGTIQGTTGLTPVYTPSQNDITAGQVTLTLHAYAIAPCIGEATDFMIISLSPGPIVNAGADITICENQNLVISGASGINYSSLSWSTNGSGTFSNNTTLNPVYYPSAGDIAAGTITLTLTGYGSAPCTGVSTDEMVLTINKLPIANAGPDEVACANSFLVENASAVNHSSINWTTSGTGSFNNASLENPVYTPSASDRIAGSVILTMTVNGQAPCNNQVADQMRLTIGQGAVANAGLDASTCGNSPFTVTTASASSNSTIIWSTSGSGTFANQNTINPTYTPSAGDISLGSVTLTLQVQCSAPCFNNAQDAMVLTISAPATAYAGPDNSVCNGTNYTVTGASASNSAAIMWSTTGSGIFVSGNTLSPTYIPSFEDYQNGNVILILTAIPQSPCSGSVSDEMLLTFMNGAVANAGPDAEICFGANFTVTGANALGAATISWSSSGSGTLINGNTISPTYIPSNGDRTAGSVILTMTVTGTPPCLGTSTDNMTLLISSMPVDLTSISGPQTVCAGQSGVNYSAIPVQFATQYNWMVPSGVTIISGAGTPNIVVDFSTSAISGNIYVTPASACGSGTMASYAVTVDPAPLTPGSISGPAQVCSNTDNVNYSVTPVTDVTGYQWSLPAGVNLVTGAGTNSITVNFTTSAISGDISVSTFNGCGASAPSTMAVEVFPIPATPIVVANGPVEFCEGNTVVLSTTNAYDDYLWSTGETTPQITVAASGTYSVIVEDLNGCSSLVSNEIVVNVHTLGIPEITLSGSPEFCQGENVVLTAEAGFISYLWNTGATTQSITVSVTGDYYVIVNDALGCSSPASDTISVVVHPVSATPAISANGPLTFCQGDSVVLSATPGFNFYNWSTGDTTQSITVTATGSYTVSVGVVAACMSLPSAPVSTIVTPAPAAPIVSANGPTSFCNGGNVTLTASSGYISYHWSNGATTQSIVVTETGSYSVTGTDATGCESNPSIPVDVNVIAPVTPVITANGPVNFCYGNSVELTAPAGYVGYMWSDGSSTQVITVTTSGDYYVVVSDATGCISDPSNIITVTVGPPLASPVITANGPTTLCQGETVTLSAPAGYAEYLWSNGEITQNIIVGTAGDYYVVVEDLNGCASLASNTITVDVQPLPIIDAGLDAQICEGSQYTLGDATASNCFGLFWSTSGTGTFSNPVVLNPVYNPSLADISQGSVVLTLTGYGCSDVSDFMVLDIISGPTADAGSPQEVCFGPTPVLGASASDYSTIVWSVVFGSGSLVNENSLIPTYIPGAADLNAGYVILSLTANPVTPCLNPVSVTKTLNIKEAAVVDAGQDEVICSGSVLNITTATQTGCESIQWSSTGTGTWLNANTINPTYYPSVSDIATGTIHLSVTGTSAGCPDATDTMILTIQPEVTVHAGADGYTCEGSNFTLSEATVQQFSSVTWTTSGSGTFNNPNLINPVYSPSLADIAAGSVQLTITGMSAAPCSGSASDNMTLFIRQEPLAYAGIDGTICQGEQYVITDASAANAASIIWTTSGSGYFLNGNTTTPTYIPGQYDISVGSVVLTMIVSNKPCADISDSQTLTIIPEAVVNAGPDVTICRECMHTVSGAFINNAVNYLWTSTGTGILTGESTLTPTYEPSIPDIANGSVTLILTAESFNNCGTVSDQMVIYINQNPDIDFTWSGVCEGQPTSFIADTTLAAFGSIAVWHWNFGDGFYSNVMNPDHTFAATGEYIVTLTVTDTAGNQSIVSHTIEIVTTPIAFFSYDTPNCFGSDTQFINLSSTENGYITHWIWNFGDGSVPDTVLFPEDPNVSHLYAAPGIYEITLTVINSYGCDNTYSTELTVSPQPIANFHYSSSCEDMIVDFFDASFPNGAGNIVSWSWNFDDPGSGIFNYSNLENPQHLFSTPGIYNVTLIVVNFNNCSDTITKQVNAGTAPPVEFIWDAACANNLTSFFADTTVINIPTIAGYNWTFGDGGYSVLQNPQHLYAAEGNYIVTLTITDTSGCVNSISHLVTIGASPNAYFSFPDPTCFGEAVQFADLSSSEAGYITTWAWDFGDGNTATVVFPSSPNVNHTYATAGVFTVKLHITSSLGCTDSISRTVTIVPSPVANFTNSNACMSEPVIFTDLSQTNGGGIITNWSWNFGDPGSGTGNTSSLQNPQHVFTAAGTYDVTLSIITSNSCTATVTIPVIINPAPFVDFSSTTGCANDTVAFNSSAMVDMTNTVSWLWDFGDGTTSADIDPIHVYAVSGLYNVTLTITDNSGCSASETHAVSVTDGPIALFSNNAPACSGAEVEFTNLSSGNGSPITIYKWYFGDGSDTTIYAPANPNVSHEYAGPGTYTVTLEITTAAGCDASVSNQVSIIQGPTADFIFESACVGSPATFTDLSSANGGSPIVQWNWEFGDPGSGTANTSTLQNPTHIFSVAGDFNVTLTTITASGCENSVTQTVTITTPPTVAFTFSGSCANQPMSFAIDAAIVDIPSIATFFWDFGDGATSTLQNPDHMYAAAGTYLVTLTVTDTTGCSGSVSNYILVSPEPLAYFSYTEPTCLQSEVQFTDLSSSAQGYITTWVWNFGDGNVVTINFPDNPNVSHTYIASGMYDVTLSVSSSLGCEASVSRIVTVQPNPVANFTYNETCLGESVQFTDLSQTNGGGQITNWEWVFGDPLSGIANTSVLQNPSHTYTLPGTYTILLTVTTSNSCIDTTSRVITITPAPLIDFTFNEGCANDTINFVSSTYIDMTTTVNWNWDFGDGTTSSVADPDHIYLTTGIFNVSLTITDITGCTATISHPVSISEGPLALFSYTAPACSGNEVQFTNMSSAVGSAIIKWVWDFGDGNQVTINAPGNPDVTHVYATAGNYHVTLTVTNVAGCDASVSNNIVIITGPQAEFEYETGCLGSAIQFTDISSQNGGSPIIQWAWDFGDPASGIQNVSNLQNPVHTFTTTGSYNVLLTITSVSGCTDSITHSITVTSPPAIAFNYSSACAGQAITFEPDTTVMNIGSIASWTWNFGDGTGTSSLMSPEHTYAIYGTFNVTLTVTDLTGCQSNLVQTVTVSALPVATFTINSSCTGNLTTFTDYSYSVTGESIVAWQWVFGDPNATAGSDTSSVQNPVYQYSQPGVYSVTLTVTTSAGCSNTVVMPVEIFPAPQAQFDYTTNACLNGTVSFRDESTAYMGNIISWQWEFEPYYYSDLQNPHHTFKYTDSCYMVQLMVTDTRGCIDTAIQEVCVPAGLEVEIDNNITCHGDSTYFNPILLAPTGDSLVAFVWNFDDVQSGIHNTSTLQNPVHYFENTGTYLISLTATDKNNCKTTVYKSVVVEPLPISMFTVVAGSCDSTLYFTDLSSGNGNDIVTWIWNYGDGTIDTLYASPADTSHYYSITGSVDVSLTTITASGCSSTYTMTIDKMPCILADYTVTDTLMCERHSLTFEDHSICGNPIEEWNWDFGDGSILTYNTFQPEINHIYTEEGTYTVTLIVTTSVSNVSVSDTISGIISVAISPEADYTANDVCLNNITLFNDQSRWSQSQIIDWQWDFNDPLSISDTDSVKNTSYLYPNAGIFRPLLTVTNELGCTDTISKQVRVHHLPVAEFSYSLSCQNNHTFFTDISDSADAAIDQWWWRFSDSLTMLGLAGVQNPNFIFKEIGDYNVELTIINGNGCADTTSQTITVHPKPTSAFSLTENYENTQGRVLFTNGTIGATAYEWDFETGIASFEIDPIVDFTEDGDYTITLISVNEFGCPDTLSVDYTMLFKGLWVPNAFSPNNPNPEVRLFKPVGINLERYVIEVYDTWGNLLWTSNKLDENGSPAEGWNGTFNGNMLHIDTYMWKISAVFKDGTIWDGQSIGKSDKIPGKTYGTVHLIR